MKGMFPLHMHRMASPVGRNVFRSQCAAFAEENISRSLRAGGAFILHEVIGFADGQSPDIARAFLVAEKRGKVLLYSTRRIHARIISISNAASPATG